MKFTSAFVISVLMASTCAIKLTEDPVVSPEAEKVSVLQTPIAGSRTTFYDKKTGKQVMAQTKEDPPAAVVSPEAEKVSVLQTPIAPYRTTFYDKKSTQ